MFRLNPEDIGLHHLCGSPFRVTGINGMLGRSIWR
ncbi:Uncharacterised protein [Vibrio cholerae]|nr:Uncharacterised protein [Vibrio cholerae]